MLPGMRPSASVGLSTLENALCVPVAALGEENGETILHTNYDMDSVLLVSPVTVTIDAVCIPSMFRSWMESQRELPLTICTTIPYPSAPQPRALPCHSDIRLKQVREHSFTCFLNKIPATLSHVSLSQFAG